MRDWTTTMEQQRCKGQQCNLKGQPLTLRPAGSGLSTTVLQRTVNVAVRISNIVVCGFAMMLQAKAMVLVATTIVLLVMIEGDASGGRWCCLLMCISELPSHFHQFGLLVALASA
jgi:hypothetical protein